MNKQPIANSLSIDDINKALIKLPGWQLKNNKLHKEFSFKNFKEAFGFMTRIAFEAESMNHHPDWFNSYKVVIIDLYRHVNGEVTDLDVELALKIESIVNERKS
ncbi:MAG: 4a-hydroxytetrahydrobiopterin dehydratase [Colwellia sp.]|nr:4a-hydroxytetrahydrobiopterin dehydratase [Colwellia sp.]